MNVKGLPLETAPENRDGDTSRAEALTTSLSTNERTCDADKCERWASREVHFGEEPETLTLYFCEEHTLRSSLKERAWVRHGWHFYGVGDERKRVKL